MNPTENWEKRLSGTRRACRNAFPDVRVLLAAKKRIKDRIDYTVRLMGAGLFSFTEDYRTLSETLQEAVWNPKAAEDERLDDGSSDTDHEFELFRKVCIYGHAWEYFYQNEEKQTRMKSSASMITGSSISSARMMQKTCWCSFCRSLRQTEPRNIPRNVLEEAQTAAQLSGIVSKETQLAVLSIVQDPAGELEKLEKEKPIQQEMVGFDDGEGGTDRS